VAEECGFDQVTYVDQQNLSRDVYVQMAVAAMNTRKIKIGQGVTVPVTRHPSVTANATASVNELSGGRAFLGIGAGGNALRSMGKKVRPMQDYRETVEFIRSYIRGEESEYQGARMHSDWITQPYPIYMACTGPASCRLAGELADAAIIGPGIHPEVVKWRIELVHQGARKAGRDPSEVAIWLRTLICIAESREAARPQAAAYASRGVWTTLGLETPEVAELRNRLERVMPDVDGLIAEGKRVYDAYDEYQHELPDAPHAKLVTQRMADFIHLLGPVNDISARIDELRHLGVTNLSVTMFTVADREAMMRDIAKEIMPRFQSLAYQRP
jgi:5,10-methylenetetrahydromethanopterin reductase